MNHLLIYPMAFYVFYINCLLVFNFISRFGAVKNKEMSGKFFKAYQAEAPEYIIIRGRHFDNQFQVPMLFMITCLAFMSLSLVNIVVVYLAWIFVVTRLIHSWVHLGKNRIYPRFIIFGISWYTLCGMWALLVFLIS